MERLWHRDFVEHLTSIRHMLLAAPCYPRNGRDDLVRVDVPTGSRVQFLPLPHFQTRFQAMRNLPATILALWRAIGRAAIVHSGIAGWPYPLGWIVNPLALLRHRKLIIIVESAQWRLQGGLRGALTEILGRWSVNHAHLTLFTHAQYRDTLLTRGRGPGYVTPAVWVDDEEILTDAAARKSWKSRLSCRDEPVRFLFAGRLERGKGVAVLAQAIRRLEADGVRFGLDFIGDGPCREDCVRLSHECRSAQVRLFEPVPYGAAFFRFLRNYHCVVVPSLTDEQPRIVFDAWSQAVPIIASDTPGLAPYVRDDETGWVVPANNPASLAGAMRRAIDARESLSSMGRQALDVMRGNTHREMHRQRAEIISHVLGPF